MNEDKPLFTATMFAGISGVYTGMKDGAFSISENMRRPSDSTNLLEFFNNVGMIL